MLSRINLFWLLFSLKVAAFGTCPAPIGGIYYPITTGALVDCVITFNLGSSNLTIDLGNQDFEFFAANAFVDGAEALPNINNAGYTLTIKNGRILRSYANLIPAFRLIHVASSASLILDEITLENGLASLGGSGNYGGGIFNAGLLAISSSTFTKNFANDFGGGIFNEATGLITSIYKSTLKNGSAGIWGGGIGNRGNIDKVEYSIIANNFSRYGAGIFNDSNKFINIINNNNIIENQSIDYGAGLANFGIVNIVSNSNISNNNCNNLGGGILNAGTINRIFNTTITYNEGVNQGGGIYNGGLIDQLEQDNISHNVSLVGGGIYGDSDSIINQINLCNINFNHAVNNGSGGVGGGIFNNNTINTINNSTICNNTADDNGAGLANFKNITLIENSTFCFNNATNRSGAIYNFFAGTINNIINTTISNNMVNNLDGGGIYNDGLIVFIHNNTLYNNYALRDGGGIFNFGSIGVLGSFSSNIISGNKSSNDIFNTNGVISSDGYNLIGTTVVSSGIVTWQFTDQLNITNPLLGPLQFNGGPTQTHGILPGSMAIGKGKDNGLLYDQRGFPYTRTGGDAPLTDCGAYEHQTCLNAF